MNAFIEIEELLDSLYRLRNYYDWRSFDGKEKNEFPEDIKEGIDNLIPIILSFITQEHREEIKKEIENQEKNLAALRETLSKGERK